MPHVHRRGGYTDRHDHLPDRRLTAHAGGDQAVGSASTASLIGSITGGIGPYTHVWSTVSGIASIADTTALATTVTLSGSGAFVFRLTVTDAHQSVAHDDVAVSKDASPDVFAALAVTLGPVALASSSTLDLKAAVSATLGALTLSSDATSSNTGVLVHALDPLTSSATATLGLNAAVAKTLGAVTLSSAAKLDIAGALSKTLGSLSLTSTSTSGGATPDYWTDYDPANAERAVYVSSLSGNDSNNGLSSAAPKLTASAGLALIRDGHADYLLFERGSTFTGGITWNKSGPDSAHPIVVGTYGTGARPVFRCGTGTGFSMTGSGVTRNYVQVHGLDFYAHTRDPSFQNPPSTGESEGLHWRAASLGFLFEDCVFRWFRDNIVIQCSDSPSLPTHIQLRRCHSYNSWSSSGSHSQGAYIVGVTSIDIDECISDHNGWHETISGTAGTIFNHNWYVANGNLGVTFTNNLTFRASSHGLQLRCGGTMTGNYADKNAIGLLFGGGSDPNIAVVTGDASDNVVVHGTNIGGDGGANKQYGLDLQRNATDNTDMVGVTCNRNVIANALNSSASTPLATGVTGVTYGAGSDANVIYNWPVGQHLTGTFLDHTRDLAKYAGTLGFTATLQGAIDQLRLQRRDAWNENLTCQNIVAYVRAGFAP